MKEYAFVVDKNGKQLSPTDINNAWRLIRTKKAKCIKYNPFTIKLKKVVKENQKDKSIFALGIDDGSAKVGFSIIQYCVKDDKVTRVKVIRKDTMIQRQDVKHLMDTRRGYRRNRRSEKRSRACRFNNRVASKRKGRIAPSVKQKREAVIRVAKFYQKGVPIKQIFLEDVSFDVRVLTEGKQLYGKEYQQSNKQDDNIRRAVYARDHGTCQMCGITDGKKEVHHITPKRRGGPDSIYNEILLCPSCHAQVTGQEDKYADEFYKKIDGKLVKTAMAQHVMIGKTYLREQLSQLGELFLTTGGDTANKRYAWNVEKSHSNDAVCIACNGYQPDRLDIKESIIKPLRHKKKSQTTAMGFQLGDYVDLEIKSYKLKQTIHVQGYITAFVKCTKGKHKGELTQVHITTPDGAIYNRYLLSKCRLINRPKSLNFMYMN